ncbi:hypothetical protein ADUPG1_009023 [Aduncisulcus paluster]|uniref:Uncharacterized protein n=1 Tax=Aduncisulcus paluster TaxID=2918883 RepID=A0ABQ5KU23_9EUKA|nr:hypothetical protein ADUPG1_009023 [Aduncisulcus paluster]
MFNNENKDSNDIEKVDLDKVDNVLSDQQSHLFLLSNVLSDRSEGLFKGLSLPLLSPIFIPRYIGFTSNYLFELSFDEESRFSQSVEICSGNFCSQFQRKHSRKRQPSILRSVPFTSNFYDLIGSQTSDSDSFNTTRSRFLRYSSSRNLNNEGNNSIIFSMLLSDRRKMERFNPSSRFKQNRKSSRSSVDHREQFSALNEYNDTTELSLSDPSFCDEYVRDLVPHRWSQMHRRTLQSRNLSSTPRTRSINCLKDIKSCVPSINEERILNYFNNCNGSAEHESFPYQFVQYSKIFSINRRINPQIFPFPTKLRGQRRKKFPPNSNSHCSEFEVSVSHTLLNKQVQAAIGERLCCRIFWINYDSILSSMKNIAKFLVYFQNKNQIRTKGFRLISRTIFNDIFDSHFETILSSFFKFITEMNPNEPLNMSEIMNTHCNNNHMYESMPMSSAKRLSINNSIVQYSYTSRKIVIPKDYILSKISFDRSVVSHPTLLFLNNQPNRKTPGQEFVKERGGIKSTIQMWKSQFPKKTHLQASDPSVVTSLIKQCTFKLIKKHPRSMNSPNVDCSFPQYLSSSRISSLPLKLLPIIKPTIFQRYFEPVHPSTQCGSRRPGNSSSSSSSGVVIPRLEINNLINPSHFGERKMSIDVIQEENEDVSSFRVRNDSCNRSNTNTAKTTTSYPSSSCSCLPLQKDVNNGHSSLLDIEISKCQESDIPDDEEEETISHIFNFENHRSSVFSSPIVSSPFSNPFLVSSCVSDKMKYRVKLWKHLERFHLSLSSTPRSIPLWKQKLSKLWSDCIEIYQRVLDDRTSIFNQLANFSSMLKSSQQNESSQSLYDTFHIDKLLSDLYNTQHLTLMCFQNMKKLGTYQDRVDVLVLIGSFVLNILLDNVSAQHWFQEASLQLSEDKQLFLKLSVDELSRVLRTKHIECDRLDKRIQKLEKMNISLMCSLDSYKHNQSVDKAKEYNQDPIQIHQSEKNHLLYSPRIPSLVNHFLSAYSKILKFPEDPQMDVSGVIPPLDVPEMIPSIKESRREAMLDRTLSHSSSCCPTYEGSSSIDGLNFTDKSSHSIPHSSRHTSSSDLSSWMEYHADTAHK